MNRIYKVIYSEARHAWVVVSELVTGHAKGSGLRAAKRAVVFGAAAAMVWGGGI